MKILHEAAGHPTIIEVERDESVIVFDKDGEVARALMSDSGEDEYLNPSANSMAVAVVAVSDQRFRDMIAKHISDYKS